MEATVLIEESLVELKQTFKNGKTRDVSWRKAQLRALIELIHDNDEKIFKALQEDLGKHPTEGYRDEVGVVERSANNALNCLEKWMAPKKSSIPLLFFPAKGELIPEP